MQSDEDRAHIGSATQEDRNRSQARSGDTPLRGLPANGQQPASLDKLARPSCRRGSVRLNPPDSEISATPSVRGERKRTASLANTPRAGTHRQVRFLTALAQTGNPSLACRASTLTRREVNLLRREDSEFALAFQDAMDEATDVLEAEAWRRALEGVAEPLVRGGKPVCDPRTGETMMIRRYSDSLLMLLLRASKPSKFSPRLEVASRRADTTEIIREIATDHDPPRRATRPEPPR